MKIAAFVGTSLLSIVVASPLAAQQAPADRPLGQPAPAAVDDEAETIIVTGSRIPRPQYEGVIPGAQLTGADIQSRGFNSVLEALNDLPLVGPGASPLGNAGGQPASLGSAFVDLLDLGTNRTLSLVNGRRFVSGNAGSLFVQGNTTGGQVDLNVIPTELVERTDVLTVGGAVAYGADAIAGVVNIILKEDFDGISASARSGISSRGDAFNAQLGIVAGTAFAGGRGNVAVSFQYNRDDGLQGDERTDFEPNFIAPTFFLNGNVRNRSFAPSFPIDIAGANNGAFLRATDDGQPGNRFLPPLAGGSILLSEGGSVFQFTSATLPGGTNPAAFSAIVGGLQTGSVQSVAGNTQVVPGGGVSAANSAFLGGNAPAVGNLATLPAGTFTRLAPTTLPSGVTPQQVIAALAPGFTPPVGATGAQLTTLAVNLLQANRQTPREYLAANPNTPINAFLGSFVPAFLDVPNTDPASAQVLPRTAVPLRFDNAGNLVQYVPGRFDASTPATLGGIPGGDYYNPTRYTVLRVQQDRYIGNLFAHFDLSPNVRLYTENLFARVDNVSRRNVASSNNLALGGTENAAIIASINNPYLTAAARGTLINAGVSATNGVFVLSRTNQDIVGDNSFSVGSETLRSVVGLKGDFGLFGREFRFDASGTWGRAKATINNRNIRDIEYALALDAVRDASGNIVCRVRTPGASTALPLGIVNTTLVRERGPDGVLVERLVPRAVTGDQINNCQPLNPFGFGQMTEAAKAYVTFNSVARNRAEQMFVQGTLATASLIDLPGGGLGVAFNGEWRREVLDYQPDADTRLGVGRGAALAATYGRTTSVEASAEARIPVFGEGFRLPLFHTLEFNPGVRFVRQDGDAPDVRRLTGVLETNEAKGKWNTLFTLGGVWRPIQDIQIRGNVTRSLRQPSIVELFLGNQPAFNTPTDPCGIAQIGAGGFAANRRANCEREVVRLGIAPDRAAASNFLTTFVPAGQALQGGFAGSPGLLPERGRSWTVGGVIQPRFIPGLTIAGDYINVTVRNLIIPTTLSNAAQFCYDSSAFGSTSGTLGVNTCDFFSRDTTFNLQNGFASGFINLGALRVRAVNGSADYRFELADLFGGPDIGRLTLRGSIYHLLEYTQSAAGSFADSQNSVGSFFRPRVEAQLRARYDNGGFFAQWTTNWQSATRFFNFNTGAFNTVEQQDVLRAPPFALHDATIGYSVNQNFSVQFVARNLFDNRYAGLTGFANTASVVGGQGEIDYIGRRFQFTARIRY